MRVYKNGDCVCLKSLSDIPDDVVPAWNRNGEMDKWCGQIVTIRHIHKNSQTGLPSYKIYEDYYDRNDYQGGWFWPLEAFENIETPFNVIDFANRQYDAALKSNVNEILDNMVGFYDSKEDIYVVNPWMDSSGRFYLESEMAIERYGLENIIDFIQKAYAKSQHLLNIDANALFNFL